MQFCQIKLEVNFWGCDWWEAIIGLDSGLAPNWWQALILTHWGQVTHICIGKSNIIGSDNSLSPDRHQAIIWTNAGVLLIGHLGTYFSEILTRIQTFLFKKIHMKMLSAKWRPFCLSLNVLSNDDPVHPWHQKSNDFPLPVKLGEVYHYQGSLPRHWLQKLTVFLSQCWHLDPPCTCADKDLCR